MPCGNDMIRITNVTHYYHSDAPVLQGVTLKVARGEFVAIAGSSGAGKTTLLSIVNGMVQPVSGTVEIAGRSLTGASGRARRAIQADVAMIYQDFRLVSECTVLDNALNGDLARTPLWRAAAGLFTDEQIARAREALAAVGLSDKEKSLAAHLSGGQKQRVAIARALMQGASVILADEPVASLDPGSAEQILSLIKTLQQTRGLTVMLNSHSPAEAVRYADRIIGLKSGRIERDAAARDWTAGHFDALYRS